MLRRAVTLALAAVLCLCIPSGITQSTNASSSPLTANDALADYQWALYNDGAFTAEEYYTARSHGRHRGGHMGAQYARRSAAGTEKKIETKSVVGIDVGAEAAREAYNGGVRDVVIALIDSGVDASHEDLQNVLWTNPGEIAGNGIDDDGNGYIDDVNGWNFCDDINNVTTDTEGHGTHSAGSMLAASDNGVGVAGIIPGGRVKIMSLKVLTSDDLSGTTASIVKAIEYAEANGASICNLSLGSSRNDTALYRAIANSGMLFSVSAGNDGKDTDKTPYYPASYELDNVISVANLNCDGTLSSSSNYGAVSVDLAAPGTSILSTVPGNGYEYYSGTSMAAPIVTAAAAMLYSADGSLTLADVKDVLLASVKKLDSLTGKAAAGGMLDLGAAMTCDRSALSHRTWEAAQSGSAPEIAVETKTDFGSALLTVTITDADGNTCDVRYAEGELTAAQFGEGSGASLTLNADGTTSVRVGGGTYTFYVSDKRGNETVKTVTFTS